MIQHSNIHDEINKRIKKSYLNNNPILFSVVEKVQKQDPLLFFSAANKHFSGERIFWTDSEGQYCIVGVGSAFVIEINEPKFHYFQIEEMWQQLMLTSSIDKNEFPSGTGPILFGGFAFDSEKDKSMLWREFPNAKFTLPKFLYSLINEEAYLTFNILCDENMDVNQVLHEMQLMKAELLNFNQPDTKHSYYNEYSENEIEVDKWMESIRIATDCIKAGDLEKVVLARETRLSFEHEINIANVIKNLRQNQANSYIFAFESNGDCFVGASPERLIKKENHQLFSTCLAGSIGRGQTAHEDQALGEALLHDHKNLIEHEVVVHMIKEAMQEVCHTISAPKYPTLYKTKHIQHLYTPVVGEGYDDISLLKVVERLHPTPALGGYPKEKALQKIRDIELLDRGWYAAPIGWMDFKGDGEFAVAIRSGLIQGKEVSLFAGCGIVADSDPVSEYHETEMKFKPMLTALGGVKHENS